ncbi:MAG: hypothetical protein WCH62_09180, partial [Candidatus Omnitrophota bacterium]
INLEIYKDRAELLRNEEKKLRQDIKSVQLKILDKRNTIDLSRATQDFLLHLRKSTDNSQIDFLVKTFMRILFKAINIQNQEIVSFELIEPWQTCYDEGIEKRLLRRFAPRNDTKEERKWNTLKTAQQTATPLVTLKQDRNLPQQESACYWKPTAGRWVHYYMTLFEFLERIHS